MKKQIEIEIDDLLQAAGLLVRRVRSVAALEELSITEAGVLKHLSENGPATTADLARAESVKPQSMGATIASLEESDLVQRRPHPTDGRQMLIQITAKGAKLREKRREAKRTWLGQALTQLDRQDRETLHHAARILRRLAEQ